RLSPTDPSGNDSGIRLSTSTTHDSFHRPAPFGCTRLRLLEVHRICDGRGAQEASSSGAELGCVCREFGGCCAFGVCYVVARSGGGDGGNAFSGQGWTQSSGFIRRRPPGAIQSSSSRLS